MPIPPVPLIMNLPSSSQARDICPMHARMVTVEGRLDALSDEVRSIAAEMTRFSESATDLKASLARTEALNIEMGIQLKRFAEYADRSQRTSDRHADIDDKLTEVIVALRVLTDEEGPYRSRRKSRT